MSFPNKRALVMKKVLDAISENGKTVREISLSQDLAWDTVNNALRTFEILGLVKVGERDNKEVFFIANKEYPHPLSNSSVEVLSFRKNMGAGLVCSVCLKHGEFGSILTQVEDDGSEWIVCGWCKSIVKKEVVVDKP